MRASLAWAIAATLVSMWGCGDDPLHNACTYTEGAFDIEEVSVLEDAAIFAGTHDAVQLSFDLTKLPKNGTWRVSSVDILAMIPTSELQTFQDGAKVGVEVFDATHPDSAKDYVVWQTLTKSALSWQAVTLTNPTEAYETDQQRAWWTFDLSATIPTTGMGSGTYIVGVVWPEYDDSMSLGYSNYNRPCQLNWTDYNDGEGWKMNGNTGGNDCNWPMLRVKVEITDPQGNCPH